MQHQKVSSPSVCLSDENLPASPRRKTWREMYGCFSFIYFNVRLDLPDAVRDMIYLKFHLLLIDVPPQEPDNLRVGRRGKLLD